MSPDSLQQGMDLGEMKDNQKSEKQYDEDYDTYEDILYVDPRCSRLGIRIIIHKDGINESQILFS